MQVKINKIIKFCSEYLKVKDFEDYCVNGLQVEGVKEVSKIITGVSLSQKLIEAAIEKKAELIMVHHGIFSKDIISPLELKGVFRDRLKMLLMYDINLAGFHLPLDAHAVIGNNVSLCKILGVKNVKSVDVGFIGQLSQAMELDKFVRLVEEKLNTKSYVISAGTKNVKTVGIISGGASPDYEIMKEAGADTYLCGDIREGVVRGVEEAKINLINAGHYNTEKIGIINLGNLVAKKFKVNVEFVDIPNEI